MKVSEIVNMLQLEVFSGEKGLEKEITGGYASDLLSDVMGNASEGQVWITLQSHMNIIAIASLKELAAIVLVKDIKPDEKVISKADEEEVVLLGTRYPAFEINGRIFDLIKDT